MIQSVGNRQLWLPYEEEPLWGQAVRPVMRLQLHRLEMWCAGLQLGTEECSNELLWNILRK